MPKGQSWNISENKIFKEVLTNNSDMMFDKPINWEIIAVRLKDFGLDKSPEQCKTKLINKILPNFKSKCEKVRN